MIVTKNADVRISNKRRIADYLLLHPGCTQLQIIKDLQLSNKTVVTVLQELDESGFLSRGTLLKSTGGRRPAALSLRADAKYAIGICLIADTLHFSAVNLAGNFTAQEAVPLDPDRHTDLTDHTTWKYRLNSQEFLHELLPKHFKEYLKKNDLPKESLLGVCISLPGAISDGLWNAGGCSVSLKNLISELEAALDVPVYAERSDLLSGLPELWLHQLDDAVILDLGCWVGGCVVIGGNTFNGLTGHSCSLGHMILHPNGRKCACGRRGCLGTYLSFPATPEMPTPAAFEEALNSGDDRALALLQNYISDLALGICSVNAVFDLPIYLCGFMSGILRGYQPELNAKLMEFTGKDFTPDIHFGNYKHNAESDGGALYVWRERFYKEMT